MLALLVYLDGARRHTATRDELLDRLWSDKDPQQGRNALRQLVYATRRRLGHDSLSTTDDSISLGAAVASDRREISAAIDRGDVQAVVQLYAGPFLGSFAQPGARQFEDWALWERERLRAAFFQACETLVRDALRRGATSEAVRLAKRLRDEDPLREASWRWLLQALGAAGDWLAIAAEQETLRQLLMADGREPESATTALVRRLTDPQAESRREAPGLQLDLVGRETEFARLLALWQRAATGHKAFVDLRGIAGIGKSRLLVELRGRLRAQGARVVAIRARRGERELEWAMLADLILALGQCGGSAAIDPHLVPELLVLAPALADRFPHAKAAQFAGEEMRRRSAAVFGLLDAVVHEGPIALLIDDVHWGDAASLQCLQLALDRLEPTRPLLCVLSSRPHGRELAGLPATPMSLSGLSRSDVETALESIAALPPPPDATTFVEAVATGSAGIPQEVIALLQDLQTRGVVAVGGDAWELRDATACIQLARAGSGNRRAVAALSPTARHVLSVLAHAGTPISQSMLAEVTGGPTLTLTKDLEALVDRGMVIGDDDGWEVAHDLISEAVLEGLPEMSEGHAALATAWLRRADEDEGAVRQAFRHARASGRSDLLTQVGAAIARAAQRGADPRPLRYVAGDQLRLDPADPQVDRLLAGIPALRRIGRRNRRRAMVACLIAGVGALAFWSRAEPSLAIVVEPLPVHPLTPAPVVELRGSRGRLFGRAPDSIRVRKVEGPGNLVGSTIQPVVSGRAQFSELGVTADGRYILEFIAPGFRAARTDALEVGSGLATQLRIAGGRIGGQVVRGDDPAITVSPGAPLSGWLDLTYDSPWVAASIMLCAARSWESAARGYWTVFPLATPARGVTRRVSMDSTRLRAPSTPGSYVIAFAHGAEPSCSWIMSLTNWAIGAPEWDDGNDLMERAVEQLGATRSRGRIDVLFRRNTREHGNHALVPTPLAVTTLSIRVQRP